MPLLTHKKHIHLNCQRFRIDFKITVRHIEFTSNQYFIANSHYIIFRKGNKSKKFKTQKDLLNAKDLAHVPVDQKLKFKACLLQDLPHKYLERYIEKEKRFILRQVTEAGGEELYVDCGILKFPLHEYGMLPSGQEVIVHLHDPQKMATAKVYCLIEHEPRVFGGELMPNISELVSSFWAKKTEKQPLPPSVFVVNEEKLQFLKSKKLESRKSSKYDMSDSDDSDSEGEEASPFNKSFLLQKNDKGSRGGVQKKVSTGNLEEHIFTNDDFSMNTSFYGTPSRDPSGTHSPPNELEDEVTHTGGMRKPPPIQIPGKTSGFSEDTTPRSEGMNSSRTVSSLTNTINSTSNHNITLASHVPTFPRSPHLVSRLASVPSADSAEEDPSPRAETTGARATEAVVTNFETRSTTASLKPEAVEATPIRENSGRRLSYNSTNSENYAPEPPVNFVPFSNSGKEIRPHDVHGDSPTTAMIRKAALSENNAASEERVRSPPRQLQPVRQLSGNSQHSNNSTSSVSVSEARRVLMEESVDERDRVLMHSSHAPSFGAAVPVYRAEPNPVPAPAYGAPSLQKMRSGKIVVPVRMSVEGETVHSPPPAPAAASMNMNNKDSPAATRGVSVRDIRKIYENNTSNSVTSTSSTSPMAMPAAAPQYSKAPTVPPLPLQPQQHNVHAGGVPPPRGLHKAFSDRSVDSNFSANNENNLVAQHTPAYAPGYTAPLLRHESSSRTTSTLSNSSDESTKEKPLHGAPSFYRGTSERAASGAPMMNASPALGAGRTGKIVVPVRMTANGSIPAVPPPPPHVVNPENMLSPPLHRTATAPSLSQGYHGNHHNHQSSSNHTHNYYSDGGATSTNSSLTSSVQFDPHPARDYHQVHAQTYQQSAVHRNISSQAAPSLYEPQLPPQASYHQEAHHQHTMHRASTMPYPAANHNQGRAYGHNQQQSQEEEYHRNHQQMYEARHGSAAVPPAGPMNRSGHIVAPPIRMGAGDIVPPPVQQHLHQHNYPPQNMAAAPLSARRSESPYDRRFMQAPPPQQQQATNQYYRDQSPQPVPSSHATRPSGAPMPVPVRGYSGTNLLNSTQNNGYQSQHQQPPPAYGAGPFYPPPPQSHHHHNQFRPQPVYA